MAEAAFLTGDRVELRPAAVEDAAFLSTTVNDRRVWEPMFIDSKLPVTESEQEAWVQDMAESDDAAPFVIWANGDRVGNIGVFGIAATTGTAEVSYFIAPEAQGNGYATGALTCLAEYAFDHLRLHRLWARTYAFNDASHDLLEAVGFVEEGVHRDEGYHDADYCNVYYYGLLVPEFTAGD